jgi:hypothetical protein
MVTSMKVRVKPIWEESKMAFSGNYTTMAKFKKGSIKMDKWTVLEDFASKIQSTI